MSLRVLQVLPQRNLQVGGPAYSVPRLADALARLGVHSEVWSIHTPHLGTTLPLQYAHDRPWPDSLWTRRLRGWAPGFDRALRTAAKSAQLIHNHGLWMFPNRAARIAATGAGIPLVCSPRGMLDDWSRRRSRRFKALVWALWERRNLAAVRLFHATSELELRALRAAGLRTPVAVIPNGVELPASTTPAQRAAARTDLGIGSGQRMLLFLSRLHAKKGVLPLLEGWALARPQMQDWRLYLAGPDLDGHGETVRQTIARLGLDAQVQVCGMLEGAAKTTALQAADAFVLTSHSENFGIAVAEAAAHALPVLVSDQIPWHALVQAGGGWRTAITAQSIAAALRTLAATAAPELHQRGTLARQFVTEHYAWPAIGAQMLESYRWLLGGGPPPACIDQVTPR